MKIRDLADDPDAGRPHSIEEALTDLVAKYAWRPSAELARMIEQLQAEIADRKRLAESCPVRKTPNQLLMVFIYRRLSGVSLLLSRLCQCATDPKRRVGTSESIASA